MSRYLKIPAEPIVLTTFKGEPIKDSNDGGREMVWSWKDYVYDRLIEPIFGKNFRVAAEIREKVAAANGVLELSDQQWQMLKDVCEAPTTGLGAQSIIGHNLVKFANVVVDAKTSAPSSIES